MSEAALHSQSYPPGVRTLLRADRTHSLGRRVANVASGVATCLNAVLRKDTRRIKFGGVVTSEIEPSFPTLLMASLTRNNAHSPLPALKVSISVSSAGSPATHPAGD